MAFLGATRGVVLRSALGVIAQSLGELTEREAVLRTISANSLNSQHSYQEWQGVVRQAQRVYRAGSDMTFTGAVPLAPSAHPIDPSLGASNTRYRYRAIVEVTSPSGSQQRGMILMDSETVMSQSQIQARIEADIETLSSEVRTNRRAITQIGPGDTVSVMILSAGRRA